jgi:predicted Zn-dependent protease
MTSRFTPALPLQTRPASHGVRASVILSLALLTACGTTTINPVTGQQERTVMSETEEINTGRQQHEEVLKEYGRYPDEKLQAYVNDVGQRLAKQSHRAHLQWHFTVLDSPEINAFALPGGYVYVTRGIMAYLDSEADLAGVMGHEIGHVTARHGAQRATQQQTAGLGVFAASILGAVLESKGMSGAGQMASNVSQSVAAGWLAGYSRDQESQADSLGAEYLARNQYNPGNMVDVIDVLKQQERFAADRAQAEGKPAPSGANWLSSHPSNDQRLADIRQIAAKYTPPANSTKGPNGGYRDDGHARYLQAINGMSFGESAEQGLTRGRNFYHEGLGFALTAPAGWKIQNGAEALTLINPQGSAGVVLHPVPQKVQGSHEEVIRQLLQPTQGQLSRATFNGLSASRFQGARRNEQGQVQAIRATLIDGPQNHRYLMVPAARDANTLAQNQSAIQTVEESFRALTPTDRQAARPWAIRSTNYPKGGMPQLAQQTSLSEAQEAHLRLLNGRYEGGEPKVGELVKVVVAK